MPAPSAVSAPGKVLLAGGYLVLDRAYTGLVFGLSARIGVVAREIRTSAGVQLTEIVVESPQFRDAVWRYGYHLAPADGGIAVTQLLSGAASSPNPFVELTLAYALTYITAADPHRAQRSFDAAQFTILADNDYYSQPHSLRSAAAAAAADEKQKTNPTRFAKFPSKLRDAHKTGLGSSAALVTSLTAALLSHYLPPATFDLDTDAGRRTLHNLAQAAHCAAQGKVGSGFDVAAAVYGSCRYRRFSPSVLAGLPEAGAPGFAPALADLVDHGPWDTEVAKDGASLPPGLALRMCDVDQGSQTVGMVRQVLAWRERDPAGARHLWDSLQARNEELGRLLAASSSSPSSSDGGDDETATKKQQREQLGAAVGEARQLIRAMGAESGVPIEPESQTALLDALEAAVPGVHGGVVPGAGGHDALALLMDADAETEARVRDFLAAWGREHGGVVVRLLDVRGEVEGVRREGLAQYDGWVV
ncbi:ribosomal protein S5 domain 2-type protein [Xylariaceae sp. FL0804]|nr:ribosomal protein S5 domain 2-type protein [Xylariaceae sp. FL0804]